MLATGAPFLAVIDADLQHDETILPRMLETLREDDLDIVVGSRFSSGGSVGAFAGKRLLLSRLGDALAGIQWEAVFVDDDSQDGTAELLLRLQSLMPRVRLIRRIGRRGLSSACIEGMLATGAPFLAVIDADLQHDETILPRMLETLREDDLDIVVGSRFAAGGSVGAFSGRRQLLSRLGRLLSRTISRAELSDPMSGFLRAAPALLRGDRAAAVRSGL